ncbi:MAG: uridine kinase [Clostridia bacterium]|nr:uridine kinase [Clostridia bacterium]
MNRTYVIGIAGGTCSGKTTFTGTLEAALGSYRLKVVHMDHYFKPVDQRPMSKAPVTGKIYNDHNHPLTMDLPRLEADLEGWRTSGEFDVVVLEGLLTLWDEKILEQLDLKLFVDCRDDERTVRRIKRHSSWGQSFDEITNVYLDLVRYRHDEYVAPSKWRADFFLNGSNPSDAALEAVVSLVEKHFSK